MPGIVIIRYAISTFIERTGSSASIGIEAPATAGAPPATAVDNGGARLRWYADGTNTIEVRLDPLSDPIPPGLKLLVQLGTGTPVEVPSNGSFVTLLGPITDSGGDEPLTYSVTLDPVSDLVETAAITVDLEYQIGP